MSQTNPQQNQPNQNLAQNLITIKINNRSLQCNDGDTVLEVARANGIFIPTICYLSGCSPTLACKMCMGENSEGKRVYTCNTKAKDGLEIFTDTPSLRKERQAIMQTYDVNHPLECGVCDKSGECELQNLTLYTQVSHQDFALPDDEKHSKFWAQAEYDPNLCIVCERCATTCKDNIGEAKLKANKADLHSPDEYKDKMAKDPYSVWSKKQKSLIEFVGETPCVDCGECIAVCPVGALTYKDFSYTANAWELKSISSTCAYCSAGCQVIYEKRHFDMAGASITEADKKGKTTSGEKIYRVKNDFHFAPICGAARFGFGLRSQGDFHIDFHSNQSQSSTHTDSVLKNALNALKIAKGINLGSQATNEEALIAQNLATHFGLKIYNDEAYAYQRLFGKLPLNHTLSELKSSSVIIALGASVRLHIPHIQYALNNAIRIQKGVKLFYVNPIFDSLISSFSRSVESISYGANCEREALLSLLIALGEVCAQHIDIDAHIAQNSEIQNAIKEIMQTKEEITQESNQNFSKEVSNEASQESNKEANNADSANQTNTESSEQEKQDSSPKSTSKIIYKALQEARINAEDFSKIATALLEKISAQESKTNFCEASLIVGTEVLNAINKDSSVADILGILEKLGIKVFVLPNGANVAGIARICTLEPSHILQAHNDFAKSTNDFVKNIIGIRASGEWVWDSYFCDNDGDIPQSSHIAKPDLILPTFSQMNATITNYENRVLPINRVLDFAGFDLGDIARFVAGADRDFALSYAVCGNLSDYALELPKDRGFYPFSHSALKNHYTQSGEDKRGYALESALKLQIAQTMTNPKQSSTKAREFNAYISYPQNLFGTQTVLDKNMQQQDGFYTSKAHFEELGLSEGEEICLEIASIDSDFLASDFESQNVDSQNFESRDLDRSKNLAQIKGRAYIDYGLSQNIWLISPYIFGKDIASPSNYLQVRILGK